MKQIQPVTTRILLLSAIITAVTTTGCIVPEGEGHGHEREHGRFEEHRDVRVESPEVVVRPPEVIVR
jgi:hypothetical protein